MKVVIAGGTGLIGPALVHELETIGSEIYVLTRHPERTTSLADHASLVGWDAATLGDWTKCLDDADAVVNLAGENIGSGLWTKAKRRRIRESRTRVGGLLVQAIQGCVHKPAALVQASAVGYYGPQGGHPLDESTPAGSTWLSGVAIDWETSTAPVAAWGVRHIVIRTGLVLTQRGGLLARMRLPFRFFVGGRLDSGRQILSWIHIEDEVRAIRFLIEHPKATGAFNLTAPHPVDNATFSRILGDTLRRPAWLPVPAPAIRLALGEMSQLVLTGQRALPCRLQELGFTFKYPGLDAALAALFVNT